MGDNLNQTETISCYEKIRLSDEFWAIQDNTVRMYLLDGGSRALLIDTGYGSGDLAGFIKKMLNKEVSVVNTHFHADHTSANGQFHSFYISEADLPEIRPACSDTAEINIVRDGDQIIAGDITLEVIAIPGHTPGSIALLDRTKRRLFSADSVAKNFPVYMQYPGQNICNYRESLHKLYSLKENYDTIWPCHGELYITIRDLENTIECCEGIINGTIEPGIAENADGGIERAYWKDDIAVFY